MQSQAQWNIVLHTDIDSDYQAHIATIKNDDGYKLEVYKYTNDVIYLRFNIRESFELLDDEHCPTFQIDKGRLHNRSINDSSCFLQSRSAEYIIGYITDSEVLSPSLYNLINGNKIYYRFLMDNGYYAETSFSLFGSRGMLNKALGKNLLITAN